MMLSNFETGCLNDDDELSNCQLLNDVEEISKALVLDPKIHQSASLSCSNLRIKSLHEPHFGDLVSKSGSKTKMGYDNCEKKGKPSSFWGWKPFKALSHVKQKKLATCFFCHVHCVENLSSGFNGLTMVVHWKRKDRVLSSLPKKVSNGVVEFEETLMRKCNVYCEKSGRGSFVKYEPKHFLLYVSVSEVNGLDVGKHWVDLTRLLPLTIEDLEEDKCLGKWSTSFKLSGKAKGATLHVSFAFLVNKDGLNDLDCNLKSPSVLNLDHNRTSRLSFAAERGFGKGNASLRRVGSVPNILTNAPCVTSQFSDVQCDRSKDVFDYSDSLNVLYEKLEEGNISSHAEFDKVLEHLKSLKLEHSGFSCSAKDVSRSQFDDTDVIATEKEIESEKPQEEIEKLDVSAVESDITVVEVIDVAEIFKGEGISSDDETKPDSTSVEVSDCVANDTLIDKHSVTPAKESNMEKGSLDSHEMSIVESEESDLSHDDILNETKVNHSGSKLVRSLSLDDIAKSVADDFFNLLGGADTPPSLSSSANLESPREGLLREFEEDMRTSGNFILGVDIEEDDFDSEYASSSVLSSDFDLDGIDLLPNINTCGEKRVKSSSKTKLKAQLLESLETQSLMQRWGLNENAFQSSPHYSTGGFGSPIFVPREEPIGLPPIEEGLGSVLHLKDGGLLRSMSPFLFLNAKNCGSLVLQASKPVVLHVELGSEAVDILQYMASVGIQRFGELVNRLMPMEELSGKIIQHLAREALCKTDVLERPASSQHELNVKIEPHVPSFCLADSNLIIDDTCHSYIPIKNIPLLALENKESLLIEGLKIHSSMSDHNAPSCIKAKSASGTVNHIDELLKASISLDEWLRVDAGVSKNDITIALMTQLRDPLRDYEPVGAPMLVLIQVKRVSDQTDDVKDGEYGLSRFTINHVHVVGLNSECGVPQVWAPKRQQQAGSRWLLASGFTRKGCSQMSKTRSITTLSTRVLRNSWTENLLWSISSSLEVSSRLIRNPDIIFP